MKVGMEEVRTDRRRMFVNLRQERERRRTEQASRRSATAGSWRCLTDEGLGGGVEGGAAGGASTEGSELWTHQRLMLLSGRLFSSASAFFSGAVGNG